MATATKTRDADRYLFRQIRDMLDSGAADETVIEMVQDHVSRTRQARQDMTMDLRRTESLFRRLPLALRKPVYALLLEGLGAQSSEQLMVHSRRHHVPLTAMSSFAVCMNLRARRKQVDRVSTPEERIREKEDGYRFAAALGERIPAQDGGIHTAATIPLMPGQVVKPESGEGSRGVFIINAPDSVINVKAGAPVAGGIDGLRPILQQMVDEKFVRRDEWISQEIIYEDPATHVAARDLKFYCFYGDCPIVSEIVRFPDTRSCWWDSDGNRVEAGKLYASHGDLDGVGFTRAAMDMALRLSSAVPAPFLRIDIMAGHDGPVLGEFTGHPGNYERLIPTADRMLGDAFIRAEARLARDLLAGKRFDAFFGVFPQAA